MKAVVRHIELPEDRRTLVVSDIHGNLPWLKGLLEKAAFTTGDILVLDGDMVEKGKDSLATLRYIMELSRTHTVHAVCGNCDHLAVDLIDGGQDLGRDFYQFYLSAWKERALICQMAHETGESVGGPEDLPRLRAVLKERFAPELGFLRALPTILTAPGYVFVHGGVPSYEHMEELDAWACMKNDDFMNQGHAFPEYCVVGHWPVTLYRTDCPCCEPIVDRERKIVSIDGGCVLKDDGQLNALVLPGPHCRDFSWYSYDDCPVRRALDTQARSTDHVMIRWTDHDVEVLERGEEFSLCRHLRTGRVVSILTKYLKHSGERDWCLDSTDYRLEVRPGDLLRVVEETSRGALVKKNGVTGWYYGRMEQVTRDKEVIYERG